MSPTCATARFPVASISLAAASALAASRPMMTTEPPSVTNRVAISLPMPELPPVTIATLSRKRMGNSPYSTYR